jgi:hypothetical protein
MSYYIKEYDVNTTYLNLQFRLQCQHQVNHPWQHQQLPQQRQQQQRQQQLSEGGERADPDHRLGLVRLSHRMNTSGFLGPIL